MLRLVCRIAPLALLLPLGGCFDSHGMVPDTSDAGPAIEPDAGGGSCDCCGTRVGIRAGETCFSGVCDPWCGRVDVDAGPSACAPTPIALACPSATIPADTAQLLEVLIGGEDQCFCGETISCTARVEAPGVLALDTGLCTSDTLCEACFPFVEGSCALPPLGAGSWTVRVNGRDAMVLAVDAIDGPPDGGARCVRRADDGGTCGNVFPPAAYGPSRACHAAGAYVGERVPIRVTDACGGCGTVAGPCDVRLSPDGVVLVRAEGVSSGCDVDCPAVCIEREDVCWTPPLPAGTWQVIVEGLPTTDDRAPTSIVVGGTTPSGEACTDDAPIVAG